MKSIPFDPETRHLPKEIQLQRVQRVIRQELTELQRDTLLRHYFQG